MPAYTVLRRGDRKWMVRISGQCLQEGWRRFALENKLEVGDFIVFKHEGNMVFEVMVFGPSHCERQHHTLDHDDVRNAERKQKETSSEKFESSGLRRDSTRTRLGPLGTKTVISIDNEGKVPSPKSRKVSSNDDEESDNNPYFLSWIKPYCVNWSTLNIPMGFAKANNLCNRRCNLVLRDPQQRSWQVELGPKFSHVCITRGWNAFFTANGLKIGDSFKFELVENGETPIVNFYF
ncbi:hypothetical protein ACH5RR_039557 [Cinchona calisaya]|uniref:TF-B3 domain-containing protein n=1 Tax=Cinchona calisaya TaxID=153742 RepID=A0ABD2Y3X1_9GENT